MSDPARPGEEPGRSPLTLFFLLAFGISWGALAPLFLLPREGLSRYREALPLLLVARFGPSLAGLWLAARVAGVPGLRDLLRRLVPVRAHSPGIALAVLGPLGVAMAASAVHALDRLAVGPRDPEELLLFVPHLAGALFLGAGLGEELGWRGFALPRLQSGGHPLAASLVLGLAWGAWRLPALRLEDSGRPGGVIPVLLVLLLGMAVSVLLSWAYNRTGGSLVVCALLRAAIPASGAAFEKAFPVLWLNSGIEVPIAAIYGIGALVVIAGTRGRLGYEPPTRCPPSGESSPPRRARIGPGPGPRRPPS